MSTVGLFAGGSEPLPRRDGTGFPTSRPCPELLRQVTSTVAGFGAFAVGFARRFASDAIAFRTSRPSSQRHGQLPVDGWRAAGFGGV